MAEDNGRPKNYEVGYQKPPRSTRFKPGQSGNPRGRPKGTTSLNSLLTNAIYKKTKVKVGGQIKNMTFLEVGLMRLMQTVAQGQPEKVMTVLKWIIPLIIEERRASLPEKYRNWTDEEIELEIEKISNQNGYYRIDR